MILTALTWAPGFAQVMVVHNRKGVLVVHHRLKAGIGAHVLTHLLAQKTRIEVSGRREEKHPKCRGGMDIQRRQTDRKSTRLNSSHVAISYAVFCLKKKKKEDTRLYADEQQTK